MKIRLNEKEEIEKIINSGDIDDKPMSAIHSLAKYYVAEGKEKDEIMTIIDEFMIKNYNRYNSVLYYEKLNDTVNSAIKRNKSLLYIDSVNITKSEIEYINGLKKKFKLVAFSYLVYAKILNKMNEGNDNWVADKYTSELFKDANVTHMGKQQTDLLSDFYEQGILDFKKFNMRYNGLKVNYLNEDDEVVWVVDDFREIGLQYLERYGTDADKSKICTCEQCGIKFKYVKPKLGGRPKLNCDKCTKLIAKEKDKLRKKKDME